MLATVTWSSGRGYWFAETDESHQAIFIHQRHVKGRRVLRVNDRVKCDVVPSDRKPGEYEGQNAEWVGICVARQTSGEVRP